MSKKLIITESERKNILSYYSIKGILHESYGEPITKNIEFSSGLISASIFFKSIFIKGNYFWPDLNFNESEGKLIGSFKVNNNTFDKEDTQNFLNDLGITEYKDKDIEIEIENITVEFDKIGNTDDTILEERTKKFLEYIDNNAKSDEKLPYLILCKDLITKGYTSKEEYLGENIYIGLIINFTSITFKVDSEQSTETPPESEKPAETPQTSQTPDSVGNSGLPEGEFEDEVLTKGKIKNPNWLKRLLTREKTELMNNLESLEGKLIEVDEMVFKISDVKVSSDIQGVLIFSCNQQKINADLVNKPKFKFVGKKDFYFACKYDQGGSIFYDSAQYVYNRQDNIYYGNSMDEIRKKTTYLEEFVYDNICKFINPKK